MSWSLSHLFRWLDLKPRTLILFGVVCLIVVGLPHRWQVYLQYDPIITHVGGWISIVGLASFLYGALSFATNHSESLIDKLRKGKQKRKRPEMLRALSPDEKEFLAWYLTNEVISRLCPIGDGVVNSLRRKDIVYRASDFSVRNDDCAFNLAEWVMPLLNEHKDIAEEISKYAPRKIRASLP